MANQYDHTTVTYRRRLPTATSRSSGCDLMVSYSEAMIADQLVVGLYDKEIQGNVLAKHTSLTTLKEKYDHITALEQFGNYMGIVKGVV